MSWHYNRTIRETNIKFHNTNCMNVKQIFLHEKEKKKKEMMIHVVETRNIL